MNDEDDDSALARRHSAGALRILAEARQALEKWLVRLKELELIDCWPPNYQATSTSGRNKP
jgi:hypothetical protein